MAGGKFGGGAATSTALAFAESGARGGSARTTDCKRLGAATIAAGRVADGTAGALRETIDDAGARPHEGQRVSPVRCPGSGRYSSWQKAHFSFSFIEL
jgi:hypothetical protein